MQDPSHARQRVLVYYEVPRLKWEESDCDGVVSYAYQLFQRYISVYVHVDNGDFATNIHLQYPPLRPTNPAICRISRFTISELVEYIRQ